jgi:hypothetical protein
MAVAVGPLAAGASAGAWGPPVTLQRSDFAPAPVSGAAVAMDPTGTAVVAWLANAHMMVAVRAPGGAFGPPQDLGLGAGRFPRAALDGNGRALAVWIDSGLVKAAERSPGSAFIDLPPVAPTVGLAPDVAFLGDGRAIVVYRGLDGRPFVAQRAPGGAFALSALSSSTDVGDVRVAAAGGYAVATWVETDQIGPVTTTAAMVSVLTPGGFGAPEALMSTSDDGYLPASRQRVLAVAPRVGPSGAADVIVSMRLAEPGHPTESCATDVVSTRGAGAGGTWTPRAGDGSASCRLDPPRSVDVAEGPSGDALLVLGRGLFEPRIAVTSKLRPAGAATYAPGPDVFVGPAIRQTGAPTAVAPLAGGRYVVAFVRNGDLMATAGDPTRGFDPAATVATADRIEQVVGVASGGAEAVAIWASRVAQLGSSGRLDVALYDDRVTPAVMLSSVALSPRRFARGTTIRWRLSVPATVAFRVARVRGSRFAAVGSFTRSAKAGKGSLRFRGVVDEHPLRPGRYRLTAVATAPGMAPSTPASVAFTVVRR